MLGFFFLEIRCSKSLAKSKFIIVYKCTINIAADLVPFAEN